MSVNLAWLYYFRKKHMSIPATTNIRTIITEVGQWAERQPWGLHNLHAPDWGVCEEVGELLHALLKHKQGIRGFDNYDKFKTHVIDALGDAMVYLSHWCYLKGCFYTLSLADIGNFGSSDIQTELVQLYIELSKMLHLSKEFDSKDGAGQIRGTQCATTLARRLEIIAAMLGFNLLNDCLIPTWYKVKQRDWTKDKLTGGQCSQQQLAGYTNPANRDFGGA